MSYPPSSPTRFSTSPAWRMTTPSPIQDEKNCLSRELNALRKKIEFKEEIIQELNRTILRTEFQANPHLYVQKLKKEALTSSMDRVGQKVRRFFGKPEEFFNGSQLIENSVESAIRKSFAKIETLTQTHLKLTKISCDPDFQKAPRKYLINWQAAHPEEEQVNAKITEVLNDAENDSE